MPPFPEWLSRVLSGGESVQEAPPALAASERGEVERLLRETFDVLALDVPGPPVPFDADAAVAEIEDDTPVVEDRLVSIERRALVRQVIDDLPELDRRLMRALFVDERDKDEVCKAFKVDRSYLRVLLHRAKLRFRALYLARTDAMSRNG